MRLQHRDSGNPCSLIGERNANDAPWICHVLDSNQVAPVPVKPIATAGDNCVWLRQARGRSGREIDSGDAGRDRNVKLTVRTESDAVCAWERALGSKRRERFLSRRFPKERSACRVRGVNCSVGCDGEIVELVGVRCVVPIYKQPVLQIVANDSVSPLLLRFIEKTVRAHCIQLLLRAIDKQPEHAIQIVLRFGEILYLAFSIRAYDFLLRDAAN